MILPLQLLPPTTLQAVILQVVVFRLIQLVLLALVAMQHACFLQERGLEELATHHVKVRCC